MGWNIGQIRFLVGRSRAQIAATCLQRYATIGIHRRIPGKHQLHHFGRNGACRAFIQSLQDFHSAGGFGFVSVNLELFVSVGDLDI